MNLSDKRVLIIGGGVAGLAAAEELSRFQVGVDLVERAFFAGGKAIRFACKATESCVKCGACMAEEKLRNVTESPLVTVHRGSTVTKVARGGRFAVTIDKQPEFIDPEKCVGCGTCYEKCPEGAVLRGHSPSHIPFFAVSPEKCRGAGEAACRMCAEVCPEGAIDASAAGETLTVAADAVILATGFTPYDPSDTPHGYNHFGNVITTLELEQMLREKSGALRPTDGKPPEKIAFFQCVGSRDAQLGHLWCSKTCCPSALRMARLIQGRRPETEVTFFYIDVQTFGKNFDTYYREAREEVRMIRAIPGDVVDAGEDRLQVTYFDPDSARSVDETFDMVVLSIGMISAGGSGKTAGLLSLELSETGFADTPAALRAAGEGGVFAAGAVRGPMTIADSVASAGGQAWEVIKYLGR